MRSITRYLARNALGMVALIVALGGTAYAASKITSSDIANNAIRSKDIRDNGVKAADLGGFKENFLVVPHTTTLEFNPDTTYDIDAGCNAKGNYGDAVTVTASVSSPDLEVFGIAPIDNDGKVVDSTSDRIETWQVSARWNGPPGSVQSLTTIAVCAD